MFIRCTDHKVLHPVSFFLGEETTCSNRKSKLRRVTWQSLRGSTAVSAASPLVDVQCVAEDVLDWRLENFKVELAWLGRPGVIRLPAVAAEETGAGRRLAGPGFAYFENSCQLTIHVPPPVTVARSSAASRGSSAGSRSPSSPVSVSSAGSGSGGAGAGSSMAMPALEPQPLWTAGAGAGAGAGSGSGGDDSSVAGSGSSSGSSHGSRSPERELPAAAPQHASAAMPSIISMFVLSAFYKSKKCFVGQFEYWTTEPAKV
jgi:hypothetical protein